MASNRWSPPRELFELNRKTKRRFRVFRKRFFGLHDTYWRVAHSYVTGPANSFKNKIRKPVCFKQSPK